MVYVNYGRTEDFSQLERDMGINVTGKIVIVRYGKIFRGNKVIKLSLNFNYLIVVCRANCAPAGSVLLICACVLFPQVKNAMLTGAKGIIMFSDPADYCAPGVRVCVYVCASDLLCSL